MGTSTHSIYGELNRTRGFLRTGEVAYTFDVTFNISKQLIHHQTKTVINQSNEESI